MKCAICGQPVPGGESLVNARVSHMACLMEQVNDGKPPLGQFAVYYAKACRIREQQRKQQ